MPETNPTPNLNAASGYPDFAALVARRPTRFFTLRFQPMSFCEAETENEALDTAKTLMKESALTSALPDGTFRSKPDIRIFRNGDWKGGDNVSTDQTNRDRFAMLKENRRPRHSNVLHHVWLTSISPLHPDAVRLTMLPNINAAKSRCAAALKKDFKGVTAEQVRDALNALPGHIRSALADSYQVGMSSRAPIPPIADDASHEEKSKNAQNGVERLRLWIQNAPDTVAALCCRHIVGHTCQGRDLAHDSEKAALILAALMTTKSA